MGINLNERNISIIESHRREVKFRRQYNEGMQKLLENYGLSLLEAEILFALCANPGCDTITKLCADLSKTKGVVSQACDRLCREGFLSSKVDKKDRRVVHFKITPAVRTMANCISRYMAAMDYVYHARKQVADNSVVFSARIDTKKNLIYPVSENLSLKKSSHGLPFRSYDTFLNEQLLTLVPPDRKDELAEQISLAAIVVGLAETESMQIKVPLHINKTLKDAEITVINLDDQLDGALITIKIV